MNFTKLLAVKLFGLSFGVISKRGHDIRVVLPWKEHPKVRATTTTNFCFSFVMFEQWLRGSWSRQESLLSAEPQGMHAVRLTS